MTRRLVSRRHKRRKEWWGRRWMRVVQFVQRRADGIRRFALRFALFLAGGVVLCAVYVLLFSSFLSVREIRVQRSDPRIDIDRVQRVMRPVFGQHLFFLSASEIFPLLKDGIPATKSDPGERGIPDLVGVRVTKKYPSSLLLTLSLDPLTARLDIADPGAKDSVQKASSGAMLSDYLTSQGLYVTYAPFQVGSGVSLPLIHVVDWGVRPSPWTPLLDNTLLRTMRNAEQTLREQFGQPVKERSIYLRAQEFHLLTPQYALWFDMRSPLTQQLLRYRLFLQTLGKDAAKEYVDLRLTDRIVYR
jgi:hypothetical protein